MSATLDLASFTCDGCRKLVIRTHPPSAASTPQERHLCRACLIKEAGLRAPKERERCEYCGRFVSMGDSTVGSAYDVVQNGLTGDPDPVEVIYYWHRLCKQKAKERGAD